MSGLFAGTKWERPVTCERCEKPLAECMCPRNASGEICLPSAQAVRVRREKRRGKMVTVIAGLDPNASDLPAILKRFKALLAAGGTVAEGEIEIQGDHRERIIKELTAMGYKPKAAGG